MHDFRLLKQHTLGKCKIFGTASLDHVSRQRPGTAREPDQGNTTIQFTADNANCVHHIAEIGLGIRHRKRDNILFSTYRALKLWTFPFSKVET